jgi:hypothetical protein
MAVEKNEIGRLGFRFVNHLSSITSFTAKGAMKALSSLRIFMNKIEIEYNNIFLSPSRFPCALCGRNILILKIQNNP